MSKNLGSSHLDVLSCWTYVFNDNDASSSLRSVNSSPGNSNSVGAGVSSITPSQGSFPVSISLDALSEELLDNLLKKYGNVDSPVANAVARPMEPPIERPAQHLAGQVRNRSLTSTTLLDVIPTMTIRDNCSSYEIWIVRNSDDAPIEVESKTEFIGTTSSVTNDTPNNYPDGQEYSTWVWETSYNVSISDNNSPVFRGPSFEVPVDGEEVYWSPVGDYSPEDVPALLLYTRQPLQENEEHIENTDTREVPQAAFEFSNQEEICIEMYNWNSNIQNWIFVFDSEDNRSPEVVLIESDEQAFELTVD